MVFFIDLQGDVSFDWFYFEGLTATFRMVLKCGPNRLQGRQLPRGWLLAWFRGAVGG